MFALPHRLDDRRFHHDLGLRRVEAEAKPVRGLEILAHPPRHRHFQRRIAPLVAKRGAAPDLRRIHALRPQRRHGLPLELGKHRVQSRPGQRALPELDHVRQAHAIGAEHSCERVDHDLADAQRVGDQARMLAARAAEALQRVAGHVVAAGDRDLLDRTRHVVDRDPDEPLGDVARIHPGARGDFLAPRQRGGNVDRLVPFGPEDLRKMLGPDLAQHDVAVGHRQRPAAPVAGRPGHRSGAVRPDPEAAPVIVADGSAPRGDGVDLQHRRAQADARHRPLAGPLIGAGEVRDVGRGAAHVEADDMALARLGRGLRHADDPAGRAGEHRILAAERRRVREAAVRLHEEEAETLAIIPVRPERSRGTQPSEAEALGSRLRSKRCLDFARHERLAG